MEPSQIAYLVTSFLLQIAVFTSILKHRAAVLVLLQRGLRWTRDCAPRTDKDKKVSEGVQQFRCWVADRMLTYLLSIFFIAVSSVQFNIIRNTTHWISDGQMWVLLAALLGCVIGKQIRLDSQRLDVLYLYFSLLSVAYVSEFVTSAEDFAYFSMTATVFLRLPALFFGPRLPMVLLGNLLSVLHASWRVLSEDFPEPCTEAGQDRFAIRQEVLMFFNLASFSWIMSGILHEKAELELERGNVASQLSAASSLLRLTCDAVIELDNDLRMTEDSPELAYMLMRSGPGATLKGANFLDFMVPDDALRVQDILGSEARPSDSSLAISPGRQIMARAFHTRFIDSYNTKICMEVFQVRYSKLDDQKCYLLGLRDFTDVKPLAGDHSGTADSLLEMDFSLAASPGVAPDMDASFNLGRSESSSDAVVHAGSKTTKEIYLDIEMEGLLIHSASSPLTHLVGKSLREVFPSPHTSLLMQSLHTEATSARGSVGRVLQYKDLPLTGIESGIVSGSMQLTKNRFDQIHVLMVFTEMRRKSENRSRRLSRASAAIMIPPSTITPL